MTHGFRNKIWWLSLDASRPGAGCLARPSAVSLPLQPGARGGGTVLPLSTALSCSPGSPFRSAVCAPFILFQPLAQGWAQGCLTQRCLRRLSESTWGETGRYEVQLLRPHEPTPAVLFLPPLRPGHGCTCSCLSARVPAPGSLLGRGCHRVSAGGAPWGVLWPLQRGHSRVPGCRPPNSSHTAAGGVARGRGAWWPEYSSDGDALVMAEPACQMELGTLKFKTHIYSNRRGVWGKMKGRGDEILQIR